MKALIATSVIALAGLYATYAHAAPVTKSCWVEPLHLTDDEAKRAYYDANRKANATDYTGSFAVTYDGIEYRSSPLTVEEATNIGAANKLANGNVIYAWREKDGRGFTVINVTQNIGFQFTECEVSQDVSGK